MYWSYMVSLTMPLTFGPEPIHLGAGGTWSVCLDVNVPAGVSGPQTVAWGLVGTQLSGMNGSLTLGPCITAVPTLSQWGLIILSLILAVTAIQVMRRRRGTS